MNPLINCTWKAPLSVPKTWKYTSDRIYLTHLSLFTDHSTFRKIHVIRLHYQRTANPGGGGYSICMHIGYVPRERPPFSALKFRSGAYNFHKFPKNPFRSITILHFLADFAVPETIIFKFSLISTRSSPPTAGSAWTQRRGLARHVLAVLESPIFSAAG